MKKQTEKLLTSKDTILAEVFLVIYLFLCITGFGINGTESPSSAYMVGILLSAVLVTYFGTKVMNDFENKK